MTPTYGFIGFLLDAFTLQEFFNFVPRMWGFAAENLVLVAIPSFVFMGVMMERSGIANDLLYGPGFRPPAPRCGAGS